MFDVRPGDGFGIFTVVSDYYGDGRIVSSHAVDKILKLVIPQESLRSNGNKGTDIILCRDGRSDNCQRKVGSFKQRHIVQDLNMFMDTSVCVLPPLDPVLYSLGVTP